MFDKKNIRTYYLMISRKIRNFLLSQKSREFLVFLFFVFVSFCFWLMQTMNDLYQAEFKMPVRLRNVPKEVVLTSELPDEIRVRVEDRGTVLLNYMLGRTFFLFPSILKNIGIVEIMYIFLLLRSLRKLLLS